MVTGWKAAGLVVNATGIGTDPWRADDVGSLLAGTECSADDGVYAGSIMSPSSISQWLKATSFGFTSGDIPAGATITGFEFEYRQFRNGIIVISSTAIKPVKAGVISGNDIGISGDWATSETVVTYGSSAQLAGLSWTQADILDTTFGVAMSVTNGSTRSSDSVRSRLVDQIRARAYYTGGSSNDPMPYGAWL